MVFGVRVVRFWLYSEPSLGISCFCWWHQRAKVESAETRLRQGLSPDTELQKECRNRKCLWAAVLFSVMLSNTMVDTASDLLVTSPHHREVQSEHRGKSNLPKVTEAARGSYRGQTQASASLCTPAARILPRRRCVPGPGEGKG